MATGTIFLLPEAAVMPDSSSGNAACGMTRRQGTETNPKKHFFTLDFDGAGSTPEYSWFRFGIPVDYASGGTLKLNGMVNATTNAVKMQARVGAITAADADTPIEHAQAAAATVTITVNTTEARRLDQSSITLTMDSAAAGDVIFLTIFRDPSDAADTSTADYELISAVFEYTTT